MSRPLLPRLSFLALLALVGLAGGCASTETATDAAASQAAAIGTWKYQVDGFAPLNQGVFHITSQDGRLRGIVRDQRRGRLVAQVNVNDARMELTVGSLHISGRIEEGQFTGYLRRQRYDASVAYVRRRQRRFRSAPLYARRVRSASAVDNAPALECRSILREANGCR